MFAVLSYRLGFFPKLPLICYLLLSVYVGEAFHSYYKHILKIAFKN